MKCIKLRCPNEAVPGRVRCERHLLKDAERAKRWRNRKILEEGCAPGTAAALQQAALVARRLERT